MSVIAPLHGSLVEYRAIVAAELAGVCSGNGLAALLGAFVNADCFLGVVFADDCKPAVEPLLEFLVQLYSFLFVCSGLGDTPFFGNSYLVQNIGQEGYVGAIIVYPSQGFPCFEVEHLLY